ncbi:hypothetical protein HDU76_013507 [Blyttiomyces sp. JEL0837]|nr:hypothetical protein HDU76_013507 [Blyttiomyces sp. JEL0837]
MSSTKVTQPEWIVPSSEKPVPKLKVNNSMTHTKTEFIPANGKHIKWYTCGPTVYDSSHLGHARTFISFDIIRRLLEDYFNYDVTYVMNITDIDDKIIISAREKYLFEQAKIATTSLTAEIIADVKKGFKFFVEKRFSKELLGGKGVEGWDILVEKVKNGGAPSAEQEPKFAMWFASGKKAVAALEKASDFLAKGVVSKDEAHSLLMDCKEIYAAYLDSNLRETVKDPAVFRDFAAYWEGEFFKDMDALNIRRPDVLTRISEYVPEVVTFVEQIQKNGFAYESQGSVYFDTVKFRQDPKHFYAKLEPWSASNIKLVQEGEGDLSGGVEKKNPADFALWKASKPGDPSWPSPWGPGRPGWHIECSAMAGDVLGEKLDIHSGGIDLAFPHHDNEIAQSEGCYNCRQWVNYFLHSGHLHIEGQKMSKSLKNFKTISETLKDYSFQQIRIMFLLHSWDTLLDFKESSLNEAKVFEAAISNFLLNAKADIEAAKSSPAVFSGSHNFQDEEKALLATFQEKQALVHEALCDNFDTATTMYHLRDMITAANSYRQRKLSSKEQVSVDLLFKIAKYITKMMRTFGVYKDSSSVIGDSAGAGAAALSVEEAAGPYVRLLSAFRDRIRELARAKSDHSEILKACDKLRDEDLVELNVVLDDREDGKALVKFVDKETILQQREEKRKALEKAAADKEEKRRAEAAKKAEKAAKAAIKPETMFKDEEGLKLYSQWDANVFPFCTALTFKVLLLQPCLTEGTRSV